MTTIDLVRLALWIEGTLLAFLLVLIATYAINARRTTAKRNARLATARAAIARHMEDWRLTRADMDMLGALSMADLTRLFADVAPSMGATEREWLRGVATELGLVEHAGARTRHTDWWLRLSGARTLTLVGAEPVLMEGLLRDPAAVVRAQAAAFVAEYPRPRGIEGLIVMLDDPHPVCRFAAKDALMRMGTAITRVIAGRLRNPNDPHLVPLLDVASVIATHEFLPVAVERMDDERPGVRMRVASLLRGIGGSDAAAELVYLLADTDSTVRATAVEALGFLNHWPAAAPMAARLSDPVSRVRLAAALALDRLGPPGELMLRRAKTAGAEPAATVARRILDDPARAHFASITNAT